MATLVSLILRVLSSVGTTLTVVGTINNLVAAIHNLLFPPGPQLDFQTEQTQVASIQAHVLDPTYGLQALQALMVANQTALLAAIGSPQQSTMPVILPTTPPSGYGNVAPSAIATAVWTYIDPVFSQPTVDLLADAAAAAIQNSDFYASMQLHGYGGWRLQVEPSSSGNANPGGDLVPLDFSTTLATDNTAVDWMNRLFGPGTFFDEGGGVPAINDANGFTYDVPWLNAPTFQLLRNQALGLGKTRVPPIWPGLANVTLGSSTALSNGLMLTGPMDGVVVNLTSVPPGKAKYAYGLIQAYQHVAALSFTDDDGHQESFEPIQFETQIYCPRTMVTAAGVIFRVDPAVTGTVVPWTNN